MAWMLLALLMIAARIDPSYQQSDDDGEDYDVEETKPFEYTKINCHSDYYCGQFILGYNCYDARMCTNANEFNLQDSVSFYGESTLIFRDNNITVINPNTFKNGHNVVRIIFQDSTIGEIAPRAFLGLSNLIELNLDSTDIKCLKSGMLAGLDKLKVFNASSNKIEGILDMRNFTGVTTLEVINLSNNNITAIKPLTFKLLTQLRILKLNDNSIQKFERMTFQFSKMITDLEFRNNVISEIENGTFAGLCDLDNLDLSFNNLTEIRADMFGMYVVHNQRTFKIRSLNLKNNSIVKIDAWIFGRDGLDVGDLFLEYNSIQIYNVRQSIKTSQTSPTRMNILGWYTDTQNTCTTDIMNRENNQPFPKSMYLDNNKITDLEFTIITISIIDLHVSHNSLTSLHKDMFSSLVNLLTLYLNNNSLTNIQDGAFNELINLQSLHLSYNFMTVLDVNVFAPLKSLINLFLDNNKITTLKHGSFAGLDQLQHLDLSFNLIRDLNPNVFLPIPTLSSLEISYNPIKIIPIDKIIKTFKPHLTQIGLNNNQNLPCDHLAEVVHILKDNNIRLIHKGDVNGTNVNGIECSEDSHHLSSDTHQNGKNNSFNIDIVDKINAHVQKHIDTIVDLITDHIHNKIVEKVNGQRNVSSFLASKASSATEKPITSSSTTVAPTSAIEKYTTTSPTTVDPTLAIEKHTTATPTTVDPTLAIEKHTTTSSTTVDPTLAIEKHTTTSPTTVAPTSATEKHTTTSSTTVKPTLAIEKHTTTSPTTVDPTLAIEKHTTTSSITVRTSLDMNLKQDNTDDALSTEISKDSVRTVITKKPSITIVQHPKNGRGKGETNLVYKANSKEMDSVLDSDNVIEQQFENIKQKISIAEKYEKDEMYGIRSSLSEMKSTIIIMVILLSAVIVVQFYKFYNKKNKIFNGLQLRESSRAITSEEL